MNPHQHKLIAALSICVGIFVAASGAAQASLIDRGGGLIYDTDLDITWLADANYARTSGYSAGGRMDWATANAWAENLSYYDSVRGVTYDDWRLPITLPFDSSCSNQFFPSASSGYNCSGSEMGHLYYNELGGEAFVYIEDTRNDNYNLFSNIQYLLGSENVAYWSTESDAYNAWYFDFANGFQDSEGKFFCCYAWAVRDGDVAAVPVPAAVWLFVSGLLALVGSGNAWRHR